MIGISNYFGLKLHDFELLRQTVELLIHIHHSYWTVCLLASCQIHFLKSQQHNKKKSELQVHVLYMHIN